MLSIISYINSSGAGITDITVKKFRTTQRITQLFKDAGYTVIEKFECHFRSDIRNNQDIRAFIHSRQPEFFQKTKFKLKSVNSNMQAVTHDTLFGLIECDIQVPERWEGTFQHNMSPRKYFSEMCPIFGNTENPFVHIGNHKHNFVRETQKEKHVASGKPKEKK